MFKENEEVYIVKFDLLNRENTVLYGNISRIEEDVIYVRLYGNKDSEVAVNENKVFRTRKEASKII